MSVSLMSRHFLYIATAVSALLLGPAAQAQTIDYGALEGLFGEPVTTSATGSPQKVAEAPADMELITADQIRRFGATNLPDVLRHVVSIDVLRWGTEGADISVRGYNEPIAPRLLVLINGRQVYLDDFGRTDWANLPVQLSEIRQIEIVKGPNAALYGFNAVGGVVNIVTYNPLYDDVNVATARVGTQNYRELSGVATAQIDHKLGVRLSAGGYESHDFSTPLQSAVNLGIGGALEDRHPYKRSLSLDSVAQLADDIQARIELTHSTSDDLTGIQADQFDDLREQTNSIRGEVMADSHLGLITGSAYLNTLDAESRYLFAKPWHNKVVVAKLQDLYKIGEGDTIRVAGEYRFNTVNAFDYGAGNIFYSVYSLSAMWETRILPDLVATNAVRIDSLEIGRDGPVLPGFPANQAYDRDIVEPSFNSGLVWKASDIDTFRLTAARGAQVPSLAELNFQGFLGAPTNLYLAGNNMLKPTIVTNYELGYDREIAPWRLHSRLSVFYQCNEDIAGDTFESLFVGPAPASSVAFDFQNIGRSREIGAEFGLNGKIGEGITWDIAYRFGTIHDQLNSFAAASLWRPAEETPEHRIVGHVGYTLGEVDLDLYGSYQSSAETLVPSFGALVPVQIGNYTTLGGRVGWRVTEWGEVALSADDASAGSGQTQTAARAIEPRAFLSLTAKF